MNTVQKIGLGAFVTGFLIWIVSLTLGQFTLTDQILKDNLKAEHYQVINPAVSDMIGATYANVFAFGMNFNAKVKQLNDNFKAKKEYNKVIYDNYTFSVAKASSAGPINEHTGLFFWLSFGLAIIGALMYILPTKRKLPGIKNNHIFDDAATSRGWIGIVLGVFLVLFYITLYFYPEFVVNWVLLVDPISMALSGTPASQWFLYGLLYTLAVVIMGVRMIIKYRHSPYQMIRSVSVMFFQTSFAFIIPEILVRLNQPYFDFKNMWPLDYDFFFDFNINNLISGGNLGLFMLVWGIGLFVVGVPVFTYFFGKRWYCSWVCGCGGLAETLGDPFRQLSDKSTRAWKIERYSVHGVLVFAIVMTAFVLYTFFTGQSNVGPIDSYTVRSAYGFWIGALFSGVVGTGFYPLMGNRVWCRFGCPLAAYLGLVQRFKSRFRITTNGGQCISCGNCSTYCEMGIDVRAYAQRGQDIVRASCVGCGVCSSVCPRGVLNLENADSGSRVMIAPEVMLGNDMPKIGK
jgi:polyferredoxin